MFWDQNVSFFFQKKPCQLFGKDYNATEVLSFTMFIVFKVDILDFGNSVLLGNPDQAYT